MKFHFANPYSCIPQNGDGWHLGIISRDLFGDLTEMIYGRYVPWPTYDILDGEVIEDEEYDYEEEDEE